MKPEEAIEVLNEILDVLGHAHNNSRENIAVDLAIQALEKQVPKKPIRCGENPDGTYQFKCSECGRLWWEKSYITKYCDKCGNLIERSEKDET